MSSSDFQFKMNAKNLKQFIQSKIEKNLVKAAFHLRGELIEAVSKEGSGVEYKVSGANKSTYHASAPGESPAVQFGQLRNNFAVNFDYDSKYIQAYIGLRGVPYAKRLEFGFKGKDKLGRMYSMEPRPFFLVTYEKERLKIKEIMRKG